MKNNHVRRVIVCAALIATTIFTASFTIVAAVSNDAQPSKTREQAIKEAEEAALKELKERVIPQEYIDAKQKVLDDLRDGKIQEAPPQEPDTFLAKKREEFLRQEELLNIADKGAYAIVNKYRNTSYSTEILITDIEDDIDFMYKIIDILKQDKITEAESKTLKAYISRRLSWLHKDVDKDLISKIKSAIYQ